MTPDDSLAAGETDYVSANPHDRFILYAVSRSGDMGVTMIDAGTYDLTWMDILSGSVEEQSSVESSRVSTS